MADVGVPNMYVENVRVAIGVLNSDVMTKNTFLRMISHFPFQEVTNVIEFA